MSVETNEPESLDVLEVVAGNPTAGELAGVTAVLDAAIDELAERRTRTGPSAWQLTQKSPRAILRPGRGAWRGFSG